MKVLVLGSAAGIGAARRAGPSRRADRTRACSALAISAGGPWLLINCSPDIGEQARRHGMLAASPAGANDAAPIRAVVLTSAAIDAAAGLLSLRDGPPLDLYATPSVFDDLTGALPLLSVLQHYRGVRWHLLGVAGEQHAVTFRIDGFDSLLFEALALPGLAPRYSRHRTDPVAGDLIAVGVLDTVTRRRLLYAPGLAPPAPSVFDSLDDADCLLVDGSAWPDADGTAVPALPELLQRSRAERKVLLHGTGSAARRRMLEHGIEVGYDGMEIVL